MSNSPLVNCTMISPNRTSPRDHTIDTITIHCVVGQLSAQSIGGCFTNPSSQASCNYGIGTDGRVVLCVEEKDRSWCSSNAANDNRAVTIECASDTTHPYAINDKVYRSLINLCTDICQRNGIRELKWKADKSLIGQPDKQNMTVHRWFANKACPGDYIYNRLGQIASEVNTRLRGDTTRYTMITGTAGATTEQMRAYIKKKNPKVAQSVLKMIPLYLSEGAAEGIRGDVAFAQSCLETGNFTFKGSAVTLDQNNFCGMGVTANGMKGNSFKDPETGIRAQIQHLKAYASTQPIVQRCVDPRYQYVQKGCAPCVEWLGIQENPQGRGWAAGAGYGNKILDILSAITSTQVAGQASGASGSDESLSFVVKTVKKGVIVNHVLLVQEILRAREFKGKDGKALKLDKDCGTNTVYAIKQYQKAREKVAPGICGSVDGVAGPKTLRDMIAL